MYVVLLKWDMRSNLGILVLPNFCVVMGAMGAMGAMGYCVK